MDDDAFASARDALIAARRAGRAIDRLPRAWLPADLAEAYRLQAAVVAKLGPTRAWKVAGVTAQQREAMQLGGPIGAPLPFVQDASLGPAELRLADFVAARIECEFAFELGIDLPSRDLSYSRDEVADAIVAMRLAIEIVDSRLPAGSGTLAELADGFNNGAFVVGPAIRDWRSLDLGAVGIVLTLSDVDGDKSAAPVEFARGSGRAILEGDPFGAVPMLANAQPPGPGLRAGAVVTTGSCTGAPWLTTKGLYSAVFDGLGTVAVRIA